MVRGVGGNFEGAGGGCARGGRCDDDVQQWGQDGKGGGVSAVLVFKQGLEVGQQGHRGQAQVAKHTNTIVSKSQT